MKTTVRPSALELAQGAEQLLDLLRDEHRGGLVEDQRAGAPVEHLEDLDALPLAHPEVLHQRVGVDVEPVPVGDLPDAPARGGDVQPAAGGRLAAQDDVLEDGEVVGELEVLVDHADAGLDGVRRARERDGGAVELDGPLVGPLHPVEDLHEGGLAGAVLADDGVHGSAADAERDVLVGHDAREALGDPAQPDGRRLGRRSGARSRCRVVMATSSPRAARRSARGAPRTTVTARGTLARPGPVVVQSDCPALSGP